MRYDRGTYVSPFARDAYAGFLADDKPITQADRLLRRYYDYHVDALLNNFLLSGATGENNLRSLFDAVTRTTFRVLLSNGRNEILDSDNIYVELKKGFGRANGDDGGARLGQKNNAELARSFVLGLDSSESTSVLKLTIRLGAVQLSRLEGEPRVFTYLMDAFDRCVPLHLDFNIRFAVISADCGFMLGSQDRAPRLGVTSAISKVQV